MAVDERIEYWRRGHSEQNFGDFIAAYLEARALIMPFVEASQYRLVGSAIDPAVIHLDRQMRAPTPTAPLVFWCGGARSEEPIDPAHLENCEFLGARGPLTRDLLNLPPSTPLGDPGLLIPLLCEPVGPISGPICVPHINDPKSMEQLERQAGGARVVRPTVTSFAALEELFKSISAADFILCGSLHAAIVACAYKRPFAFWDTGHVDVPFKWRDFAASIGIQASFASDLKSGRQVYETVRGRIVTPKLTPLLGCCPFAVRPEVWAYAFAADAGLPSSDAGLLRAMGAACMINDPVWIDDLRMRQAARREELRMKALPFAPPETLAPAMVASVVQAMRDTADRFAAEAARAHFSFEKGADRTPPVTAALPRRGEVGMLHS